MISDQDLMKLICTAGVAARSLDSSASILRTIQEMLPRPALEEVEGFLKKERPLTLETYLSSLVQLIVLGVEQLAFHVRMIDPEFLSKLPELEAARLRLDAIKQRIAELERNP